MEIVKQSKGVIRINMEGAQAGWEQNFLLMSDGHLDHPNCDTAKFKRDMEMAKDLNAMVIMAGDMCDATGGKHDPRRNINSIKKPLHVPNYYDGVEDDVVNLLSPYKDNIAIMSMGNHEDSVERYCDTNLVDRITRDLRREGSKVVMGGYGGFIRFSAYMESKDAPTDTKWMYFHHGKGGTSAPVTRGMIDTNRQAVWLRDVDYVLNGHNHQGYITVIPTLGPTSADNLTRGKMIFLRTPGYLSSWSENVNWDNDWNVQNGTGPSAVGCILMRLSWDATNKRILSNFQECFD